MTHDHGHPAPKAMDRRRTYELTPPEQVASLRSDAAVYLLSCAPSSALRPRRAPRAPARHGAQRTPARQPAAPGSARRRQAAARALARRASCSARTADRRAVRRVQVVPDGGEVQHPDLHWFFPRARLKDAIRTTSTTFARTWPRRSPSGSTNGGVYEAPGGDEGIFVATIRALVQTAVDVAGDGATESVRRRRRRADGRRRKGRTRRRTRSSSCSRNRRPTRRSSSRRAKPARCCRRSARASCRVRVAPLSDDDVRAFLADPTVAKRLDLGGDAPTSSFGSPAARRDG